MARSTTVHVCQSCGYRSAKWLGRCPDCGTWSSLVEETIERAPGGKSPRRRATPATIAPLDRAGDDERVLRFPSGLALVDRVLGGGVVTSGAALLAGEPGIGKSTLILQMGHALASGGVSTLYVSAEESPRQLRLRAERLGCADGGLLVAGETRLEAVLAALDDESPRVVLIDSIQALRSADLDGPPGSIGQVRHCADRLVEIAKARQISLFLVGHVTKEGAIAGPKSLEHLVDTVLTFEGEGSPRTPRAASAEEPFRPHRRGRPLRDARLRSGRGARPVARAAIAAP